MITKSVYIRLPQAIVVCGYHYRGQLLLLHNLVVDLNAFRGINLSSVDSGPFFGILPAC